MVIISYWVIAFSCFYFFLLLFILFFSPISIKMAYHIDRSCSRHGPRTPCFVTWLSEMFGALVWLLTLQREAWFMTSYDFMTCIQSVQVTSWRIASPMKQLFGSWRIQVWKASLKGLLLAMLWGSHSDFAEKPWDPKFECCRLSPAHDFHLQSWKKLTKTQTIPLSQGLSFRIFSLLGLCFCVWLLELVFVACPSSPCWQSHDISCIAQDKELIVLYGDMVPWLRTQANKKYGKWWLLVQLDARHSQNGPLVSWLVVLHSRGYRGV